MALLLFTANHIHRKFKVTASSPPFSTPPQVPESSHIFAQNFPETASEKLIRPKEFSGIAGCEIEGLERRLLGTRKNILKIVYILFYISKCKKLT